MRSAKTKINFRPAIISDVPTIWEILKGAILRRKADGSNQWQDGYPNPDVVRNDIAQNAGYVLTEGELIIGYFAAFVNNEPAYDQIEGQWLTLGDFLVVHRMALAENRLGKGLAKIMFGFAEQIAREKQIGSIKVDTNFDNLDMLSILKKLGYTYCGEVHFRGSPRKAFEKVLNR
jgi:GNAT superfamily N-acetyltransferase